MTFRTRPISICLLVLAMVGLQSKPSFSQDGVRLLGEICRVKGQETNTLQGWGVGDRVTRDWRFGLIGYLNGTQSHDPIDGWSYWS